MGGKGQFLFRSDLAQPWAGCCAKWPMAASRAGFGSTWKPPGCLASVDGLDGVEAFIAVGGYQQI